jgi:soluble lytic murein transglycosylase-like protein
MMRQLIRKPAASIHEIVKRLILPFRLSLEPLRSATREDRQPKQRETASARWPFGAIIGSDKSRNLFNAAAVIVPLIVLSFGNANAETAALFAGGASLPHGKRLADYISQASQRFDIPKTWIRAVISAESCGDAWAVSPAGAMGLMQIMPQTWSQLRAHLGLGSNPFSPQDNIMAGAAYLRAMYDRFGMAGFLAAYNAGPVRYEQHIATGQPLPIETQRYVAMLMPMIKAARTGGPNIAMSLRVSWTQAPLFVSVSDRTLSDGKPGADVPKLPAPFAQSDAGLASLMPRSNHLFVPISGRKQP